MNVPAFEEEMRMVRIIARTIHRRLPRQIDIEELISAGTVGLFDAFAKFNPDKRVRFQTYAKFRVRGAILDSLRTLDWSPRSLRRKSRKVDETIHRLAAKLTRMPAEDEVADAMGMQLREYQYLLGDLQGLEILPLSDPESEGHDCQEVSESLAGEGDDPEINCSWKQLYERLDDEISKLPVRERLVVTLSYYDCMPKNEIASVLGVVKSGVSRIHSSAIMHLHEAMMDITPPMAVGAK